MPSNFSEKKFVISSHLLAVILIVSFGAGWFLNEKSSGDVLPPAGLTGIEETAVLGVDFGIFWEAWRQIESDYVGRNELDAQKMVYGAVAGLVRSLDDPYSAFMSPEDKKRFLEDVSGSFEGIGIEIGFRQGVLTVISPLEGTPAQKVGLKAEDKIIKINGEMTADFTIDEAVNKIRGPKGTEVTLTILRNGEEKTKDITIKRGVIDIPTLTFSFIEKDGDKIAHLKLFQFSENAATKFNDAAGMILRSGADGIILDLRNNPGGYLEIAQDIAGWFLDKDSIVAIEDFGEPEKREEYRSRGPGSLKNYPLVILVNGGSASASEILAGALRDNNDVKLIGEKTFGKGTVQELKNLSGRSGIKLTVAKWLTPSDFSIHETGLEPDIFVKADGEEGGELNDFQLEKAIDILSESRQ